MRSPNLFVTSTHTPVLFFSTHGKVYRLKVWRLPEGAPQARGRPMVNLLPLAEGETISTVLPLPEDEDEWGKLHVIFATAHGGGPPQLDGRLRQHPDQRQVRDALRREIASSDRLIGVALLTEEDDVLLATRHGKAIRFAATTVREFQSRTSTGVRGISLKRRRRGHLAVDPQGLRGHDRGARGLSARRALEGRRARGRRFRPSAWPNSPTPRSSSSPSPPTAMASAARPMNIAAPIAAARASPISTISPRNGPVVASFPAHAGEQLMLVTDQAKLIRMTRRRHPRHRPQHARACACSTSPRTSMSSAPRGSRRARRKPKPTLGITRPRSRPTDDAVIGEDLADGGESPDE